MIQPVFRETEISWSGYSSLGRWQSRRNVSSDWAPGDWVWALATVLVTTAKTKRRLSKTPCFLTRTVLSCAAAGMRRLSLVRTAELCHTVACDGHIHHNTIRSPKHYRSKTWLAAFPIWPRLCSYAPGWLQCRFKRKSRSLSQKALLPRQTRIRIVPGKCGGLGLGAFVPADKNIMRPRGPAEYHVQWGSNALMMVNAG